MKRPFLTGAIALLAVIGGAGLTPMAASATPAYDLSDPTSLLQRLAPNEIQPTSDETIATVSTDSRPVPLNRDSVSRSSAPTQKSRVTIEEHETTDGTKHLPVSVIPPAGQNYTGANGNYEVFQNTAKTLATYVQAVPGGSQTIFAIANTAALTDLSIDLGEAIVDIKPTNTSVQLLELASGVRLALYSPWAQDATGRQLPTSYRIHGSTITQTVVADSEAVYPVIADPAWSYESKFNTGRGTDAKAKSLLHSCFNCYFPISGAPHAFPTAGQNLPLYVGFPGLLNFHCTFGTEYSWTGPSRYGFNFTAASGHIDGIGSTVSFAFFSDPSLGGANVLDVYGYIVNSNPGGLSHATYTQYANLSWQQFATNIANAS